MATIVLIRAGCTDYDEQSRLPGNLDLPMNDRGVEQVRDVIRQLQQQEVELEAIYAPPSDPARATARAIAEAQPSAKLKETDDLRNVNQGLWQGLPEADVRKRHPKVFRSGREKPQAIYPPEGESLIDACRRVAKVINKALRKHSVFAVVASDPIITVIRCTVQGRCPNVASCLCGEEGHDAVEFFETDKFDPEAFVQSECSETVTSATGTNSQESAQ